MWRSKRPNARNSSQRRLAFEQCESRRLMAVTTSLSSGTLTITGDAGADDIAIVGTANPGEITVTGRNGTEVNGVVDGTATISGVTAHLNANFGDGDNVINIDNVYLAGHLELETEAGDDRLILGASGVVSAAQYCTLFTGDGSDVLRAEPYKLFVNGQIRIRLEGGGTQDALSLIGASSNAAIDVFASDSDVNEIVIRGVTAGGNLSVTSSAQINNIAIFTSATSANLLVGCESGRNSIYIDTCYAARFVQVLSLSSSTEYTPPPPVVPSFNIDATVTVARCQTPQIIVRTGGGNRYLGGNDTVDIYGNNIVGPPIQVTVPGHLAAHVTYVETGDGNDRTSASYNVARGDWFFSFSQLDDVLALTGNRVSGFASADGGTGTNRLNLFGNQFGGFASTRFQ